MKKLFAALLCACSLSALAASPTRWTEVQSPHFTVITDSSEKDARKVAGQLERMRALFQQLLPYAAGDAGLPITVFALKDRRGFEALEPAAYRVGGSLTLDGLFLRTNDRNYILLRLDHEESAHPFSTIYHEYTHFIMRTSTWMPLWLGEGLAEFYQNTDIGEKMVRFGQPDPNDILYLREHKLIPVKQLFLIDHDSPYYHEEQKGSVFYAESWALTHLIEMGDFQKKTKRLHDYAKALASGAEPLAAAETAFGDLNGLQRELDAYVKGSDYRLFELAMAFPVDEASYKLTEVTTPGVDAIRADVMASDGRQKEATALLASVLVEDPTNAQAYETKGMMAMMAGRTEEGHEFYKRAVELDSNSYFANYSFAVSTLMLGKGVNDPQVEASLKKAIALEPKFAPSYDALSNVYMANHGDLALAYKNSIKAIQLDPGNVNFRVNAAQVLMAQKNFASAISSLTNTKEHVAKSDAERAMVESRLVEVRRYQKSMEEYEAHKAANPGAAPGGDIDVSEIGDDKAPKLPVVGKGAAMKSATGVIHKVACHYPSTLVFEVDGAGKPLTLFTGHLDDVQFSTMNMELPSPFDPCKVLDGLKGKVGYRELVGDGVYAGELMTLQVSK